MMLSAVEEVLKIILLKVGLVISSCFFSRCCFHYHHYSWYPLHDEGPKSARWNRLRFGRYGGWSQNVSLFFRLIFNACWCNETSHIWEVSVGTGESARCSLSSVFLISISVEMVQHYQCIWLLVYTNAFCCASHSIL